ncbi:MAG: hypothetical protein CM1200mP9_10090 [Gammaproteobacteria bacterium]|nr:MAG: hypothetical protein CM1200mP9_10090 [Gammaproteobacteria bacterium]
MSASSAQGFPAVQSTPVIAEQAQHLTVFQRTPNFSVPARNEPLDPAVEKSVKADYAGFRELANAAPFAANFDFNEKSALECSEDERNAEYERRWDEGGLGFVGAFNDLIVDKDANDTAAEFVRGKTRGKASRTPRWRNCFVPNQSSLQTSLR